MEQEELHLLNYSLAEIGGKTVIKVLLVSYKLLVVYYQYPWWVWEVTPP